MASLYPLRFEPIFRRYVWGGRRLGTVLGKAIGAGEDWAESWEVCDHGADQTRVAAGPLEGTPLAELVAQHGAELFGRHHPQPRFPLLFKFLDAHQKLSVQVHPDDARAARLEPPDLGKSEAWIVLAAEPGALIYSGLKRGFDRQAFEREVRRETSELCLHHWEPQPGDCVFVPAGAVHALGEGLLVAEIQQASDTTYRLYDWRRLGTDGRPRPLHIEQGLEAIDYGLGPIGPVTPRPTERPHAVRLVECDKFVLDRWQLQLENPQTVGGDERFHLLVVLAGGVSVAGDAAGKPLEAGQTMLLPASCGAVALAPQGSATLLDIYLP